MAKGKYQQWLEPDGLIRLRRWARNGKTDKEIADAMGINTATLYRWKNEHCEICEALKETKELHDAKIEDAIHDRAVGFTVAETTTERDADGNVVKTITKERYIPGDVTAMIFWLKNRLPKDWKDKPVDDADEEQL